MTYSIAIIKQGITINIIEGIEAIDALEAIARIEAEYKPVPVQLSASNGQVIQSVWTGYEFQARRLDFVLS